MRKQLVHLLKGDERGDRFAEAAQRRFWTSEPRGPRPVEAQVVDLARWVILRREAMRR